MSRFRLIRQAQSVEENGVSRSSMLSEFHLRDFHVVIAVHLFRGKVIGSQGITDLISRNQGPIQGGTDVLFMPPEIISGPIAGRFLKEVDSGGILKSSSFTRVVTMSKLWSLMFLFVI